MCFLQSCMNNVDLAGMLAQYRIKYIKLLLLGSLLSITLFFQISVTLLNSCTGSFLNLTTSVSCSNTTLNISEYQVILLK